MGLFIRSLIVNNKTSDIIIVTIFIIINIDIINNNKISDRDGSLID